MVHTLNLEDMLNSEKIPILISLKHMELIRQTPTEISSIVILEILAATNKFIPIRCQKTNPVS